MLKLVWKKVEGSQDTRPKDLEITVHTVYLRKNVERITKEPIIDGEEPTELWQYDECQLTLEEYEEYMMNMQNPSVIQMMQQMSDIQSDLEMQGVTTDMNTETIMQAISDLSADVALMSIE